MHIIFWILGIVAVIYLLLVIPAGIAVYINKIKYKKSPERPLIDNIIKEYKNKIVIPDKIHLDNLVKNKEAEIITRNGHEYSINYYATKDKNKYSVIISVGKFHPITIGHAEKFDIQL